MRRFEQRSRSRDAGVRRRTDHDPAGTCLIARQLLDELPNCVHFADTDSVNEHGWLVVVCFVFGCVRLRWHVAKALFPIRPPLPCAQQSPRPEGARRGNAEAVQDVTQHVHAGILRIRLPEVPGSIHKKRIFTEGTEIGRARRKRGKKIGKAMKCNRSTTRCPAIKLCA